ncbi:MAG TPA: STAS domain-containing protein [Pyrinomonadaceae bacterium]|jgi:anti-sigma B factor antagonist
MNSLSITDRQIGNVIILNIDGDLRIGEGSDALRKAIGRLLAEGQQRILLNMAHVAYIDSSGLGELIASYLTLQKKGGEIKLLRLTQRVRELMSITKLLTVFDVYEDESAALISFKGYVSDVTQHQSNIPKVAYHEMHS